LAFLVVYAIVTPLIVGLGILIGAAIGGGLGGFIGFVAAAIILWMGIWRHFFESQRWRKPVTLVVDGNGLKFNGEIIPLRQIAEFNVRPGGKGPDVTPIASSSNFVVASTSGGAAAAVYAANVSSAVGGAASRLGAKAGNALRERQAMSSCLLTLRTTQGSGVQVLAGGLTPDCARSLMDDLSAAVSHYTSSARQ
jgi:hypothetical protein